MQKCSKNHAVHWRENSWEQVHSFPSSTPMADHKWWNHKQRNKSVASVQQSFSPRIRDRRHKNTQTLVQNMIVEWSIARSWHCTSFFSHPNESSQTDDLFLIQYQIFHRSWLFQARLTGQWGITWNKNDIGKFSSQESFEKVFQFNYHPICLTV